MALGGHAALGAPAGHRPALPRHWNNKAARGYAASEQDAYSSVYRSRLLSDRLRAALAGDGKLTLPGLVDAMELAGASDLRAHALLPLALAIVGRPRDARLRAAVGTLLAALDVPRSQLYGGDAVCRRAGKDSDQWCYDAIRQRPIGGATQPLIAWVNRPTFQQAVEIQHRVAR